MALGKYKLALRDYERVCKVRPNDKDAKLKFTECRKIVQQIAFNKAISVEDQKAASVAEALDIESMTVEDKYDGPKLNLEQSSGKNNQMSIYALLGCFGSFTKIMQKKILSKLINYT